ncbi:MAG: PilZ domain-containing protein [Rhizorhabdus sp.]
MASRWRRRRVCELHADGASQMVALRDISGGGAWLDTRHPPQLGEQVELRHPHAGSIIARVSDISEGGIRISFDRQESAVSFALAAIAADMTRD